MYVITNYCPLVIELLITRNYSPCLRKLQITQKVGLIN